MMGPFRYLGTMPFHGEIREVYTLDSRTTTKDFLIISHYQGYIEEWLSYDYTEGEWTGMDTLNPADIRRFMELAQRAL